MENVRSSQVSTSINSCTELSKTSVIINLIHSIALLQRLKIFLYLGKWIFLAPSLKNFLYFFQNKLFYIWNGIFVPRARKTKIFCVFLIFRDGTFQPQATKISYTFLKTFFYIYVSSSRFSPSESSLSESSEEISMLSLVNLDIFL